MFIASAAKPNSGCSPNVELAQNHGLSDRDIRTTKGLIEEHRDEIHQAWGKHFGR